MTVPPGGRASAGAKSCDLDARSQGNDPHNPAKPLVDKLGRRHAEAVLRAWSQTALRRLNVRWVATGEPAFATDARAESAEGHVSGIASD
jgi:hypothetical protein